MPPHVVVEPKPVPREPTPTRHPVLPRPSPGPEGPIGPKNP